MDAQRKASTNTVYALFTEDGLDQEVYSQAQMRRERKDLQAMGCTVVAFQITGKPHDIDMALEAMNERVRDMKPLSKKYIETVCLCFTDMVISKA